MDSPHKGPVLRNEFPYQGVIMWWNREKYALKTCYSPCKIISECHSPWLYHNGVIMNTMVSQISGVSIVYLTVCSGADQRKHQSSASLVLVRGFHRWPVDSHHKGPVTQNLFPFDDSIMYKKKSVASWTHNLRRAPSMRPQHMTILNW